MNAKQCSAQSLFTAVCFGCLTTLALAVEDQLLLPAPLNSALPRIEPGMTAAQAQALLTNAYPKLQASLGVWSGQTGYIDLRLDDRYTISFGAHNPPGGPPTEATAILGPDLRCYIFDHQRKHRLEISQYNWAAPAPITPRRSPTVENQLQPSPK